MNDTDSRPRILIVDDTKANIAILLRALQQEYRIGVAMSGQAALSDLETNEADLVLLDIMMPEMDGYEVCRWLKADERLQGIPVIFITAMTEIESKTRGFELGAVDYITKPFEVVEVKARVRTHLQLESTRRDLANSNRELDQRVRELEAIDRLVHAQMSAVGSEEACQEIVAAIQGLWPGLPVALLRPDAGGSYLRVSASSGDDWPAAVPTAAETVVAMAWRTGKAHSVAGEIGLPLACGERAFGALWIRQQTVAGDAEEIVQGLRRVAAEGALLLQATSLMESIETGQLDLDDLLDGGETDLRDSLSRTSD